MCRTAKYRNQNAKNSHLKESLLCKTHQHLTDFLLAASGCSSLRPHTQVQNQYTTLRLPNQTLSLNNFYLMP